MLSLPTRACLRPLFLGDRLQLKTMNTKGELGFGVGGRGCVMVLGKSIFGWPGPA